MSTNVNDFNARIIDEFRANGGVLGPPLTGRSMVLLTTTGARSGVARVTPLAYLQQGDDIAVFASKAGAPTNPDWYHNLLADPHVTVELGTESYEAVATVLEGDERDRVYAIQAERTPVFADYAVKTDRVIPVVVLKRVAPTS
jgi:deazaflavin-dependent oxidoreductase (nitroreductase family)